MARRRSSYYDTYWPSYAPAVPIAVEDGIKAKSQRGKFVKNWWASQWIKSLTQLMDSGRLTRGRSYARRGQVLNIAIEPGHVSAQVQGTRRTPYKISMDLRLLSDKQWDKVFDALADQAIFSAQLLNGEMPTDIEQVFDAVKVPLFPASRADLDTDCSCPDWANPCKHIAAVYYLLGERFDEDPFLLFELRGRNKEEVAAALRERRAQGVAHGVAQGVSETEEAHYAPGHIETVEADSLANSLDRYWILGEQAEELTMRIATPKVDMALLKRLGVPSFLDARSFWPQMERIYDAVTGQAMNVAFADTDFETDEQDG